MNKNENHQRQTSKQIYQPGEWAIYAHPPGKQVRNSESNESLDFQFVKLPFDLGKRQHRYIR